MTRTLFVGDLHAKPDLLPLIGNTARRHEADRIILLGDICDDWNLSNNMQTAWVERFTQWVLDESKEREIIPLLGNHDIPYWMNSGSNSFDMVRLMAPGFKPGAYRKVHELLHQLPFRIAWSDGKMVASHAGFTRPWMDKYLDVDYHRLSPIRLVELTNRMGGHAYSLANRFYYEIGRSRGGSSRSPSPVWADLLELTRQGDDCLIQIVGHTPVDTITRVADCWFCDTFSTTSDGRRIGDGSMLLMRNDGDRPRFTIIPPVCQGDMLKKKPKTLVLTPVLGLTCTPSERTLTGLGFQKSNRTIWYLWKLVGPEDWDISLTVELNPTTGEWGELVMDESTGEPYLYEDARPLVRERFENDINGIVVRLNEAGLTGVHVDHSRYGSEGGGC